MADTATLNVRMDAQTKDAFTDFCDKVGVSASSLMNMFAKAVVRDQRVPFAITTRPAAEASRWTRVFPADAAELDAMLAEAEAQPLESCIPADAAFAAFERGAGW